MKKSISFLLLICLFMIPLAACGRTLPAENETVTSGYNATIYQNTVYYVDRSTLEIRYQTIGNVQEKGIPLIGDVLAGEADNPLALVYTALLLVDEAATQTNDGYPVLIAALRNLGDDFYKIIAFDTQSNHVTILKDGIGPVQSLHLYGEYLLYSTNDGDLGCNVHSLKKDGSESYTLPNPDCNIYTIKNCYRDEVYIEGEPALYKATLTMENLTHLFDNYNTPVFFFEDYLYYREFDSGKISRRPLSDLSQNEMVISDCTEGIARGSSYLYLEKAEGETTVDVNAIYLYEANSDENRLVFQNTDLEKEYYYKDFTDTYILFDIYLADGSLAPEFMVYRIDTQERIYIPY